MKKQLLLLFTLLFILYANPLTSFADEPQDEARYIAIFKEEILQDKVAEFGGEILQEYESIQAATIEMTADEANLFKVQPFLKAFEKENKVEVNAQETPWGHTSINLEGKEPSTLTGKGIKIAILDTGVDANHPDLTIAGGACVLEKTYDPNACRKSYSDENGHGTHVAGVIAAKNNDIGIVGVAPNAEIYAVKVLDSLGNGTTSTVMAGLEWAINNDMDIINMSLTTPYDDIGMEALIDKAYEEGIMIIAAAGNSGTRLGNGDTVQYPGKFSSVIAVSAINQNHFRIASSSSGPDVELAAPGDYIYSTYPTYLDSKGYAHMTGTSMAAPFVTGLAALYLEKYPDYTNKEIRELMQKNAQDTGQPGRDNLYGYGIAQTDTLKASYVNIVVPFNTTEKGLIKLNMEQVLQNFESYNVYRDAQPIKSNSKETFVEDFGTYGRFSYSIYPVINNEEQRDKGIFLEVDLTSPQFNDLSNSQWYSRHVMYLYSYGILNGYDGGYMKPDRYVTRGEAVAMLGRALNLNGTKQITRFSDVPSQSFASGYIESAARAGILSGFANGTFKPDQPVTRAEMAILLSKGFKLTQPNILSFSDVVKGMAGYQEISNLAVSGITKGYPDGSFRPQEQMTRSAFAVFLARAVNPELK